MTRLTLPKWTSPLSMVAGLGIRPGGETFRRTPALEVINRALVDTITTPDSRLCISVPPQEGKTSTASRAFPLWALWRDRSLRIVIVSYSDGLARSISGQIRMDVQTYAPQLGMRLRDDTRAKNEWALAEGGGVYAVGIGGGLSGRPADLMLLDDVLSGRAEAESAAYRERMHNWWTSVGSARLSPGAPVVIIGCLTGDTPVLMADGTERPMVEIRPGDLVATYEHGQLSTSRVLDWINQGPDSVLSIRMKSGVEVRANARHPFLVVEGDNETWVRTDSLLPGHIIRRVTGGSGAASLAPLATATSPRNARACAHPTTTRLDGQPVTDPPQRLGAMLSFATTTGLGLLNTTGCSLSKVESALYAPVHLVVTTPPLTGPDGSALTMTMPPMRFADCSATTATSLWDAEAPPKSSAGPLTTWKVAEDEVVSVTPMGTEVVYDLQIERTENFIANGLVSHNTRYHEDDMIGHVLNQEDGDRWRYVNIPAQADHDPSKGELDILGREPGEFMQSARGRTREQWQQRKVTAGSRDWAALYQGRPSPAEGGILKREHWRFYDYPLWVEMGDGTRRLPGQEDQEVLISVDCAFKNLDQSDYVAIQVWMRRGVNAYLLDQAWGHFDFVQTCQEIVLMSARWPDALLKVVEDAANGPAVIATLRTRVGGIVPETPQGSKESRAYAMTPFLEAGNVWLPDPGLTFADGTSFAWIGDFIEECSAFPNASHDDRVDAATMAINRLLIMPFVEDGEEYVDEETRMADLQGWSISPL